MGCPCLSCEKEANSVEGTWQLYSATLIEKGDTAFTDYTKGNKMIKIINDSHFSFLNHDLNQGKDSANAMFSAGGGVTLWMELTILSIWNIATHGSGRVMNLNLKWRYCNDTVIQQGVEKLEILGIERLNIEKYVRVKERGK